MKQTIFSNQTASIIVAFFNLNVNSYTHLSVISISLLSNIYIDLLSYLYCYDPLSGRMIVWSNAN